MNMPGYENELADPLAAAYSGNPGHELLGMTIQRADNGWVMSYQVGPVRYENRTMVASTTEDLLKSIATVVAKYE